MYKKFLAFHFVFGIIVFYLWYDLVLQKRELGNIYKLILQIILIVVIFAGYAMAGAACRKCKKINMFLTLALVMLAVYELQILYVYLMGIDAFILPLYSVNGSFHALARSVIGIVKIKNPAIEQMTNLMGLIHAMAGLLPPCFTVLGMYMGEKIKGR